MCFPSRKVGQILVGTSGYGYTEWVGPVYPQGTRKEEFLAHYASMFATVELNFSYYRMPTAEQSGRMLVEAPSLFFSVKANEALTHKVEPSAWKDAALAFRKAVEPLAAADRLGAILFQFPYSFHYDVERRRYLAALLAEFSGLPAAVEFRNGDWFNNRVIDALRARRVALASLDLPALEGLPPIMDVATAPLAYVRFHGRNAENWWGSDSASRYDYLYSDAELEAWAERVDAIAEKADRILVYFNNHRRGQAIQNARTLASILARPGRGALAGSAPPPS
jgi:uncharacterized protein YecE (DUF72 family)